METPLVEITYELIDRFLERRGWRKDGEVCWTDPMRRFSGLVYWVTALEIQLDRDHKAAAAEMTRNLGALATTGVAR